MHTFKLSLSVVASFVAIILIILCSYIESFILFGATLIVVIVAGVTYKSHYKTNKTLVFLSMIILFCLLVEKVFTQWRW